MLSADFSVAAASPNLGLRLRQPLRVSEHERSQIPAEDDV